MSDERPIRRRAFFRQGLGELLRPLVAAVDPVVRAAQQFGEMDREAQRVNQSTTPPPGAGNWVRPPGTKDEDHFASTCIKSGECVKVCPVHCIVIDPGRAGGVPHIAIDSQPCVMCNGILCTDVCPSGALTATPAAEVKMGTAVWREMTCLRRNGQDCRICIDDCPVGEVAITLQDGKVKVLSDGCTGCGVCQNHCPTNPKSIVVVPINSGMSVTRRR